MRTMLRTHLNSWQGKFKEDLTFGGQTKVNYNSWLVLVNLCHISPKWRLSAHNFQIPSPDLLSATNEIWKCLLQNSNLCYEYAQNFMLFIQVLNEFVISFTWKIFSPLRMYVSLIQDTSHVSLLCFWFRYEKELNPAC